MSPQHTHYMRNHKVWGKGLSLTRVPVLQLLAGENGAWPEALGALERRSLSTAEARRSFRFSCIPHRTKEHMSHNQCSLKGHLHSELANAKRIKATTLEAHPRTWTHLCMVCFFIHVHMDTLKNALPTYVYTQAHLPTDICIKHIHTHSCTRPYMFEVFCNTKNACDGYLQKLANSVRYSKTCQAA